MANKAARKFFRERSDCRLCGSRRLIALWQFGKTPLANSYLKKSELKRKEVEAPLNIARCQSCNLVQLTTVVDPKVLFSDYLYVSSTSPKFVAHFKAYARSISERFDVTKKDLVVDVGSNDGILLKHFAELGVNILGIDPAENVAEMANKRGLRTLAVFFNQAVAKDIRQKYGPAKIITANNVFAHTDQVRDFAVSAKELLAEDGVFVFEVQYLKDLVEQNLFDIVYHEHLCYYHLTPLVPFFSSIGLEVFDVRRMEVHGGSLRVFVGRSGKHSISKNIGEFLKREKYLNTSKPYRAFMRRIKANEKKLRKLLKTIKKAGKRVVGYGAPAKATTLSYVFKLTGNDLDYIVDDDKKIKQGLFMPGTHIPIRPPEALYSDQPDYCLVLAWNFAALIVKNHERFTKQGGRFIIPVPSPKIIS
ncbi:MAG: class I SAM-dependent methyltransferase [Candidatus Taylorbacteria bacterium]|nr:class I SAM-dependent methyltransferase [Candidatus Taylorbacteria bacterium]